MNLGIDIGSTTAKIVITDASNTIIHSKYIRHKTEVIETLLLLIQDIPAKIKNNVFSVCFTGSAGMGIAEKTNFSFVQEVIATSNVIHFKYPHIHAVIDIGGEDAKLIFYEKNKVPDIRMNGSCAGGTGAFLDQIATLTNVPIEQFNDLALQAQKIYPIASRCGVFAKTDVQNLLSRKVPKADIIASSLQSIALQVINSLARGVELKNKILCTGGPFSFIPELKTAFSKILQRNIDELITPDFSHLFPAFGAAFQSKNTQTYSVTEILSKLKNISIKQSNNRLTPLFTDEKNHTEWILQKNILHIPIAKVNKTENTSVFVGIDSGSTTTKTVFLDQEGNMIAWHYQTNNGNPIQSVIIGLEKCAEQLQTSQITFIRTAVTGYGEDIIRAAFSIDDSIVETLAHLKAAQAIFPKVSFIIDIGGQDMKAMYVKNGVIQNIEINEACSSGCGSFIQGFAENISYSVQDFAKAACQSTAPCNLGSRCTVFMNSQVKQALRENASIADIAAGLSYSIIKNALYKVLRINNTDVLGNYIMVQGGTFKNDSVYKAMEDLTAKKIYTSSHPELMGALGAAYYAKQNFNTKSIETETLEFVNRHLALEYETSQTTCRACTNLCSVTKFTFKNNAVHFSGNKCEKVFSSKGKIVEKGENLVHFKYKLLFDRDGLPVSQNLNLTIGIPRILGMYANYPFWNTLFRQCGIKTVLSDETNNAIFQKGQGTIMSDNICFPAKVSHGHILNLSEKQIDRIFYPIVIYEEVEHSDSKNTYNCPIVSSYSEVLDSSISLEKRNNIPIDKPVISFKKEKSLRANCFAYLKDFGVKKHVFEYAFERALEEQKNFKEQYRLEGFRILEDAKKENKPIILLAGRPYHIDPLIHQKVSDIFTELGATVITEEIINQIDSAQLSHYLHVPQWNYPNRIFKAAQWVCSTKAYTINFVHLNSFGCGPDSFISDEIKEFFEASQSSYTFIRVDEQNSTGSLRLRIRSLMESISIQNSVKNIENVDRKKTPKFLHSDKNKQIIGPFFTEFHTPFVSPAFELMGYNMHSLPVSDKSSVELGLKYANNEVCFPATLIIGDIIKALQSGKYDPNQTVVVMSQTGGQCRASNYLSLIKKALIQAGFYNTPVISLATGDGLTNEQPGFSIEWKKILKVVLYGTVFGDILSRMHYATIVREKVPGQTKILTQEYLENAAELARKNNTDGLVDLLKQAVKDYNNLVIPNAIRPQIGIVGEIYLKYNPYANMYIANWLIEQGVEVRFPDLLDFFTQEFVNLKVNDKQKVNSLSIGSKMYVSFIEQKIMKYSQKLERIAKDFMYYKEKHSIYDKAKNASDVLNLAHQFGEGWLIPAEVVLFAKEKVNNVISLQPFGCIANHIISKGIEKKLKDLHPNLNLLFLDFDGSTSEVNIYNRLHFIVQNAKNEAIGNQKIEDLKSVVQYNDSNMN